MMTVIVVLLGVNLLLIMVCLSLLDRMHIARTERDDANHEAILLRGQLRQARQPRHSWN